MRGMPGMIALVPLAAAIAARPPATWPANETGTPVTVRSVNSTGSDLKVPLCPAPLRDGLARDGIATEHEKGVTPASIQSTVPALMTERAIQAAGVTHIGNFNVIVMAMVNRKGLPQNVCLRKSSGYGLDASAAKAVEQYRFDAAKKDGKPVRMRVAVDVRFVSPKPPPIGMPGTGEPPR